MFITCPPAGRMAAPQSQGPSASHITIPAAWVTLTTSQGLYQNLTSHHPLKQTLLSPILWMRKLSSGVLTSVPRTTACRRWGPSPAQCLGMGTPFDCTAVPFQCPVLAVTWHCALWTTYSPNPAEVSFTRAFSGNVCDGMWEGINK